MASENRGNGTPVQQESLIASMLLRSLVDVPSWMENGLCVDSDLDPFYDGETEQMKALCASCPVLATCRAYGREVGVVAGVSGGESTEDRA